MDRTAFTLQIHHTCLSPHKHSSDGATITSGSNHLITAYYSFIDPERMKGQESSTTEMHQPVVSLYLSHLWFFCTEYFIHLYPHLYPSSPFTLYPVSATKLSLTRHFGDIYPLVSRYKLLVRDTCIWLHVSGVNTALEHANTIDCSHNVLQVSTL